MKKTSLYDTHVELGARMVEFGGFLMPVQYTSISEEHIAVREAAGLFDVSHMGEFLVKGEDAVAYLNYVTTNDVSKLSVGKAQYTCLLNEEGGIVDDLIVYMLSEENGGEYMLVVNAANIDKDWEWLVEHKVGDVVLENISEDTALFALQGPRSTEILNELTDFDTGEVKFYHFVKGTVAGVEDVLISGTGYTGSGGFELYMPREASAKIWAALMALADKYGMLPAGLGARDTLRLEMGFCLYGHEINDEISPAEAGLGWITKTKKGDFIGKDKYVELKEAGTSRKLVGFTLDTRRVPRQDYPVVTETGKEVGVVTSGTQSPCLGKPIGLAYVDKEALGNPLSVKVRKKTFPMEIVKPPFYK